MGLVSVVMPTYNDETKISLAVASVLAQDYSDLELVIVNDASTDHTLERIKCLVAQDDRIVVINNERNLGRATSRNRAIECAKGDLIAILDADDIAMAHRLNAEVAYMQDHPEVGLVGSWAIAIDEDNQPLEPLFRPITDAEIRWQLGCLRMPFVHSTVMFRRDIAVSLGMYDARFAASEDFHLCSRIARKAKMVSLPEFLVLYRVHIDANLKVIRDRYRWAAYAGWDVFRQQPTMAGLLNLGRFLLFSYIPKLASFSTVHKNKWDQNLLDKGHKSEVENWITYLNGRFHC